MVNPPSPKVQSDIQFVLGALPHRYPFLLVDRVLEIIPQQSIIALKNVSANEPYFPGHFPQSPIMPGVLLIESLAQASGILILVSEGLDKIPNDDSLSFVLSGVDEARFRRPVTPGDQVTLHSKLVRRIRNIFRFESWAEVNNKKVCEAKLLIAYQYTK